MRQCCFLLFLLALAGATHAQTSTDVGPASGEARPNVLFIAVDDLRPELGVYGAAHIHSPRIDRLAESGMLFRRAYVQQAVCSPSRTSLMTGLRPDSSRVYDLATHFRETVPDVVTLPQHFGRHGYRTAYWGKIYHAGLLDSLSWTDGGDRLEPEHNWRGYVRGENQLIAAHNRGRGPAYERVETPDGAYPDGQIASHAVASLRRFAEAEEPFFLAVGFYKPHLPFNAPERYWALYDSSRITLPDVQAPPEGTPELATTNWGELRNYHGIPEEGSLSDSLARTLIHGYYASVSYTDAQVGRVLDELDRVGLAENTIVVLWGDHGWKLGDYGDWSKHTNFELDARAPLIVRAPGRAAGQETDALVEFVDIYPALTELAGLPLPPHLQGTSFAPLLNEPGRPWKSAVFSQYPRRFPAMRPPEAEDWERLVMGYSVRTDRWRYTRWQHGPQDAPTDVIARELYDMSEGPAPTLNLAGRPEHAALIDSLDAVVSAGWRAARPADVRPNGAPSDGGGAGAAMDRSNGYADAIEGVLNLHEREPMGAVAGWIDGETRRMWAMQDSSAATPEWAGRGIVNGWHGDGNFARTSLMYSLWKTKGLAAAPWRADVAFGAVQRGDILLVHLAADNAWTGRLRFDPPRHRTQMGPPMDWPRINQFPGWFTVDPAVRYRVIDAETGTATVFGGATLAQGMLVDVRPDAPKRLLVIAVGTEP